MAATRYAAGAAIERKLKKKFEDKGFYVIRSAGSKGLFDLVLVGYSNIYLVQVKGYTKGDKPKVEKLSEYDKIKELKVPKNVKKSIILYERYSGKYEEHLV